MSKLHHPQSGLLIVRQDKRVMIPIEKDVTSIGRKQADILLDDPKVSSSHAEISKKADKFWIFDLNSTNGTYLNRRKISEACLADQDVIEIGFTTLCFFEDLRDFHGTVETQTGLSQIRATSDPRSASQTSRVTTTSRTMTQPSISLEAIEGPQAGQVFRFRKSHILIGREEGDLVILDADLSRKHLLIEVLSPQSIYVRDLGSTNGSLLNGERIQSAKIKNGDLIQLGSSVLRLSLDL